MYFIYTNIPKICKLYKMINETSSHLFSVLRFWNLVYFTLWQVSFQSSLISSGQQPCGAGVHHPGQHSCECPWFKSYTAYLRGDRGGGDESGRATRHPNRVQTALLQGGSVQTCFYSKSIKKEDLSLSLSSLYTQHSSSNRTSPGSKWRTEISSKMTCNKSLYGLRLGFGSLDNDISLRNPALRAARNPRGFRFNNATLTTVLCGSKLLTTDRHIRWDHFQTGYSLTTIGSIYCNKLVTLLLPSAKKKQLTCLMDLGASSSYCRRSQQLL